MSNTPSRDGPSHQTSNVETSYTNWGQHATGTGIINNINQTNYQTLANPLEELEKHCSHNAAFDSAARFDPPRCAGPTRRQIIGEIENWINGDRDGDPAVPSSIFWLHGGAGVGKSAIAQSLSEIFQDKKQLVASFFFFRNDPTRRKGEFLIPTLVSHLLRTLKVIGPFVDARIRENPALFTKICWTQIQELLVEPLLALKSEGGRVTRPLLIVIDGLDECEDTFVQSELLCAIARAIRVIPYPFRFFITSRPEAHIAHLFNHNHDLKAIAVQRHNLSADLSADEDIHKFLQEEFAEICRVHCLGPHLPPAWPGQKAITSLVERASGHFIYASTVITYIRSAEDRPDDRLEVILCLRPPGNGDQPYAQLDALYTSIFRRVDNTRLEKICLVLGFLYFHRQTGLFSNLVPDRTHIERLLEMKAGDLFLLLNPILSLIAIEGDSVRIFHKFLFEYLLDSTRRGNLPFNVSRVHESLATYILKQRIVELEDFQFFAYHCQYAYLNDTLKKYLHSLRVPPIESSSDLRSFARSLSILWFFLRTLSREDFDGRVHEQYMERWMRHLNPPVPRRTRCQIGAKLDSLKCWPKLDKPLTESKPQTEVDGLKRELDAMLMEWKPQTFNQVDRGMDSARRFSFIEQEHSVLSAYIKAYFPGNTSRIVSSLVPGDYFIHSYDFAICNKGSFLALRTYSKHGNSNICTRSTIDDYRDIVQKTGDSLRMVEDYLLSDIHQKYGLILDKYTPDT